MCGICGVAGPISEAGALALAKKMNQAMVHRGPDDEGYWASSGIGLGMQRLSIIDVEGGHQPIWAGDREGDGTGIIFNGEIYNHDDLRSWLLGKGYNFRTRSDTEVVLRLYEEEGLFGLERLEGMFAICLYDPAQQKLHLIRDRLGIKPLYYTQSDGLFLFGSEIKVVLAGMPGEPNLSYEALHQFLTFRFVPAEFSIWQGIQKLPPGCRLTLDLQTGHSDLIRYWQLKFNAQEVDPHRDYVAEFDQLFTSAVEKRLLNSDVPVGVLLSGGLDSSAVSAAAVASGHSNFHTFSIAFDDGAEFNEHHWARKVAQSIGSHHHEMSIGQKEFMDFLPNFVRLIDEPHADLASVPLYYVSKLAREHVKVVLSGEGSDELLAGYSFDRMAKLHDRLRKLERVLPNWLLNVGAGHFAKSVLGQGRASAVEALAKGGVRHFHRELGTHMTNVWADAEKSELLKNFHPDDTSKELLRSWYDASTSTNPLDQVQQVYAGSWLVEDLLMKADKMSMAASLELRVPFLDHKLAEWAAELPAVWKTGDSAHGYVSKNILRQYASRHLPKEILNRPKQGFPVPAYLWLQGRLGVQMKERLMDSAFISKVMHRSIIESCCNRAISGDLREAHKLWVVIVLDYWAEAWGVS